MRITASLLGLELDITLADPRGDVLSSPIGFTASHDLPDEMSPPWRD